MNLQIGKHIRYGLVLFAFSCANYAWAVTCNLYVSSSGDNTNGSSLAHAFKTPQAAEDWMEQSAQSTISTYTIGPSTYTRYTIKAATTVCIAAGTYDALNASQASPSQNNTPITSAATKANYTLEVKVTGTASAPVTFTALDTANRPTIIQTGFAGIKVDSTASYITLSNLIIKGHAYDADKTAASGRFAASAPNLPPAWPYYDGNCITIQGNPVDYYEKTDNVPYPVAVPTHITVTGTKVFACGGGGIAAQSADYLTITKNVVKDNAWWSTYGTSGISALTSVDSELYPTKTGTPATTVVKTDISQNYVYGNREYVGYRFFPPSYAITDGEGIIVDTNANGTVTLSDKITKVNIPRYSGQTRVADNVIWNNGSAAVEVLASAFVTVSNNTTYQNRYYPPDAPGGTPPNIVNEPDINVDRTAGPLTVVNNILYGPYPIAGHACKSTSGNVTYSCNQIGSFSLYSPSQSDESVFIGNNLYYGGGQPVDAPLTHIVGTKNEGGGEQVNSNPQYVATPAAPSAYGLESSDALPNLRVNASSAASYDGYFGYSYLSPVDITGATQPGSEKMLGAFATYQ